jgi:hypothetical protein
MKVVCLRSSGYHLTEGKIYDVTLYKESPLFSYYIINDIGHRHAVEGDIFQSLDEVRELKLKELGI